MSSAMFSILRRSLLLQTRCFLSSFSDCMKHALRRVSSWVGVLVMKRVEKLVLERVLNTCFIKLDLTC